MHANITPAMVELTDAITVFRTYPHTDMAQTWQRAFELLEQILAKGVKPCKAYRQIPFLIPLSAQQTKSPPCNTIYDSIPARISSALLSIDFACGFPPADIHHCGASLVVYGSSQTDTDACADQYFADIVQLETNFSNELFSAKDSVVFGNTHGRPGAPVIIALEFLSRSVSLSLR